MKTKFKFSLICTIIVLIGGVCACVAGFFLVYSVITIIVGIALLILAIASLIEIKKNKNISYENDVSSRVSNSFFGDGLFKPYNCVAFFIKNANKFNILLCTFDLQSTESMRVIYVGIGEIMWSSYVRKQTC